MAYGVNVVTAEEIATVLGGKRQGRQWRCPCPIHGGRSLVVTDGHHGKVLLHCFAGCDWREVFAELRRQGLSHGRRRRDGFFECENNPAADEGEKKLKRARMIWASARPAERAPQLKRYFHLRGITGPIPVALRWLESCRHPGGVWLPAMVARIDSVDGQIIGVHQTFLRPDGGGKADVDTAKAMLGRAIGGAVRLTGMLHRDQWLCVGEGIESTASAMQLWGSCGGMAALSASGLRNLVLPPEAQLIVIACDNDENGVGQAAARDAAWLWTEEGRTVRVKVPPKPDTDFNDILNGTQ